MGGEAMKPKEYISRRSGQVMIFFIMILVILVFVVLWNFDLHKLLYVKSVSQNAGDASSLMGARWQGLSLNLVGDLNIMQAIALSSGDTNTVEAIGNIQARLCFVGPMVGFHAAQQAAKNNGIFVNEAFSDYMHGHADVVRNDYTAIGPDGNMLFPEPYPGAWSEYADILDFVASEGIAAGPDNMILYTDAFGAHPLHRIGFYEAIAGQNWCWFFNNEPSLLEDYENFFPCWWPPLPAPPVAMQMNSEIFSLGLTRHFATLSSFTTNIAELNLLAGEREFSDSIGTNAMEMEAAWYCYDSDRWTNWTIMSDAQYHAFPLAGELKEEYDYVGADAVVRVEATTGRLTPGARGASVSNTIIWTSAAKPFGHLGGTRRPDHYGIVLPSFRDVRLIPIDASSAPSGGGYNMAWREHIEDHLDDYMDNGPLLNGCWYCQQLNTWENKIFRLTGVAWLDANSDLCNVSGPGSGPGGGTRRGH